MQTKQLIEHMKKWSKEHHWIYRDGNVFWDWFFKELEEQAWKLYFDCYTKWTNDESISYDKNEEDVNWFEKWIEWYLEGEDNKSNSELIDNKEANIITFSISSPTTKLYIK